MFRLIIKVQGTIYQSTYPINVEKSKYTNYAKVGEDEEDEDEIREAFKNYDVDGDGFITKQEMMDSITRMGFVNNVEEEAVKCIADMDIDGDGKVSYAEFVVKWRTS